MIISSGVCKELKYSISSSVKGNWKQPDVSTVILHANLTTIKKNDLFLVWYKGELIRQKVSCLQRARTWLSFFTFLPHPGFSTCHSYPILVIFVKRMFPRISDLLKIILSSKVMQPSPSINVYPLYRTL